MKSLVYKLNRSQMRVLSGICEFKNSERGDTNFISIILIVAIVVVLAAAFMALANGDRVNLSIPKKTIGHF